MAGAIVARDVQTIIVNRMQVDWITPTSDAATIFPDAEVRSPFTAKLLKDFTGGSTSSAGRQRGRAVPRPSASARRTIAAPNTTSASPTPRWVTTTRPDAGRARPVEDRLAERRRRVRVVVEQPGVAVGQELAALVDQEQRRRPARPRRRSTSRSRPGTTSASGASQSLVMTWRTGPNEAAVTTTSASRTAARASGATDDRADPVGRLARRRPAPRPAPDVGRRAPARRPGSTWPEHGEMAAALDPGPDERGARRRARLTAGANRRMATPDTAAVRIGGDRPAVEDRRRQPGRGVVEDHDRVDRRHAAARCSWRSPATHFMPTRSSPPSGSAPAQVGRHRVRERARRAAGWTPILAGSSASATSAVSVRSASRSRSSSGGIAAMTSAADR